MSDAIARLNAALEGRYQIERELGEGGMATVYLAHDVKHERKVALKVLRPELAAVVGAERFLAEIKTTANLQHPHILPLHDSGAADGFLFYVMPYVEGETLRDKIRREGSLAVDDTVRLLREVADGLAYAHSQGLIHRDIKPANILLSGRHATIADFGVAKALSGSSTRADYTATGFAVGTPKYMAPEQAGAEDVLDQSIDVYSFGVLAYEALSGEAPFQGSTPHQIVARQLTEDATPIGELRPDLPEALAALVMRCLEKDPADRWPGVHEVLTRLEGLGLTTGTTPVVAMRPTSRLIGAALVVGLAVSVGLTAYLIYSAPSAAPPTLQLDDIRRLTTLPGNETSPSLSPDGEWVAFVADASGNRDIWVQNLAGNNPFQVTHYLGDDYDPAWSVTTGSVSVVHDFPNVSRDGRRLAYTSSTSQSDIWVVAMDPLTGLPVGGARKVVDYPSATDGNPVFLPDGRHFLFSSDRGGGAFQLYSGEIGGDEVRLVAGSRAVRSGGHGLESVSPDGRWLVEWEGAFEVYFVPFDPSTQQVTGSARRLSISNAFDAVVPTNWSSDSRYVAAVGVWDTGATGLIRLENLAADQAIATVLPIDSLFLATRPNIARSYMSADGEYTVFTAYEQRNESSLFVLRAGSDQPQLVWDEPSFLDWMGDPNRIHFWPEEGGENEGQLGFVPFDPRTGEVTGGFQALDLAPTQGTLNPYGASLSPDGRWLLFAWTEVQGDIYVAEIREEERSN